MSKERDGEKPRSEDAEEERTDEEVKDDEQDDDEEEDARSTSGRAGKAVASKRARPRRRPVKQLSEKEINSPEPQTLFMLGVVALMTVLMWGFARFACNAHPARTVKPREVSTQELARDPKDAAIELQQRWATKHYTEALELATGSAAAKLKKDKKACAADKKTCDAESKKLAGKVMTQGTLLSTKPSGAVVRVTSTGGPQGKRSYLMHLRSSGTIWKADSRRPDTGAAPAPAPSAR